MVEPDRHHCHCSSLPPSDLLHHWYRHFWVWFCDQHYHGRRRLTSSGLGNTPLGNMGRIEPANHSYTIRVGFANTKVPYKWSLSTMWNGGWQKYFFTCLQISTYISTGLALFPGLPTIQFLHTASDQELDGEKAWERGYTGSHLLKHVEAKAR